MVVENVYVKGKNKQKIKLDGFVRLFFTSCDSMITYVKFSFYSQ